MTAGPLTLHAAVNPGAEGKARRKNLDDLRRPKAHRSPLVGLLHYERCRLVLQPRAVVGPTGPRYLPVSDEGINEAALLKALKFT